MNPDLVLYLCLVRAVSERRISIPLNQLLRAYKGLGSPKLSAELCLAIKSTYPCTRLTLYIQAALQQELMPLGTQSYEAALWLTYNGD